VIEKGRDGLFFYRRKKEGGIRDPVRLFGEGQDLSEKRGKRRKGRKMGGILIL